MSQVPCIVVQLVHIQGPLKGQIQEFSQFPVHIGRHASCQIRFGKEMTTVSRQHARIEQQDNRFRILDVSTNGTYVNGKRIANVYLRDGDVITFAKEGPKASFLTKIAAERVSVPGGLETKRQRNPARSSRQSPDASTESIPFSASEPDLTAGPDLEIPVISADAPLVVQIGEDLHSFGLLPITIGADSTCYVVIADPDLADRHVQIFYYDGTYFVKDLTGSNQVTINGRPVGDQSVIALGAELALTENGPRFEFLGSGRLAEIQDRVAAGVETADTASVAMEDAASASSKNPVSLIKGLFKKGKKDSAEND